MNGMKGLGGKNKFQFAVKKVGSECSMEREGIGKYAGEERRLAGGERDEGTGMELCTEPDAGRRGGGGGIFRARGGRYGW